MKPLLLLALSVFLCSSMNAGTETGMEGVIAVSPAHGGPIRVGEPDSKPLPNVAFNVLKGDEVVATFTTDEHGAFRVALPPGHYKLTRKDTPGGIGRFERHEVEVTAGEMKKTTWTIDSGMR